MNFVFIVEDSFGPAFFDRLFHKKIAEGIFSGKLYKIHHCPIGNKTTRIVSANVDNADRIIIIVDADGIDLREKKLEVIRFVKKRDREHVKIVLLDHEIEEWICYSEGISFDSKPSEVLKHHKKYRKQHLPQYADKIDCTKLQNCNSFKRLESALKS